MLHQLRCLFNNKTPFMEYKPASQPEEFLLDSATKDKSVDLALRIIILGPFGLMNAAVCYLILNSSFGFCLSGFQLIETHHHCKFLDERNF